MKQDSFLTDTPKDAFDCDLDNVPNKTGGTHTSLREEMMQKFEEIYNPESFLMLTDEITISPEDCQAFRRFAIWRFACEVAKEAKLCSCEKMRYKELRFYSWALKQLWAGKPEQYLSDHVLYPLTLPVMLDESMRKQWLDNLMKRINFFQSELNDFVTTVTWDEIVTVVDNNYPEVVAAILDGHGFKIGSTNEFCQSNLDVAKTVINTLAVKCPNGKKYYQLRKVVFDRLSAAINIFSFARLAMIAMREQYENNLIIPMVIKNAILHNQYSESIDKQIRQLDHDQQKALVAFILEHGPERLDIRFNPPIVWAIFGSGAIHVTRFCSCISGSFHNKSTWNSSVRFGSDRGYIDSV